MEAIQIIVAMLVLIISVQILFIWAINARIENNLNELEKWLDGVKKDEDTQRGIDQCEGEELDQGEGEDISYHEEESAYNTYLTAQERKEYLK